jgi:cytochrome bd-type quinol oxidase subunit 2
MQLPKLIAKMAAVIYLSATAGAFFSADYYRKIADDFFGNSWLIYLAGFITAVIGLLIVTYHNRWTKNWTVLITILGWLVLIKGILLIAFPQFLHSLSERMLTDLGAKIFPYSALCLGLMLAYFGFVSVAPPDKSPNRPRANDAAGDG